jgi:hypothetical protein
MPSDDMIKKSGNKNSSTIHLISLSQSTFGSTVKQTERAYMNQIPHGN